MRKVLTIAGSDCSGGAGIQADIKTITVHKMYAESVIAALTAQNTTGVYGVMEATPEFVANQIDCVFKDIVPDAVKIGMVSNAEIIEVIAKKLSEYNAKNIVVDPVMIATSGSKLLCDNAIDALINRLLPIGTLITPNLPEAEALSGVKILKEEDMITAAKKLSKSINGAILIKGGHLSDDANDLIYYDNSYEWICAKRIDNENTHGTGCTLSSAIACGLADGNTVLDSVKKAKKYLAGAIERKLDLGHGRGPLEHTYIL